MPKYHLSKPNTFNHFSCSQIESLIKALIPLSPSSMDNFRILIVRDDSYLKIKIDKRIQLTVVINS